MSEIFNAWGRSKRGRWHLFAKAALDETVAARCGSMVRSIVELRSLSPDNPAAKSVCERCSAIEEEGPPPRLRFGDMVTIEGVEGVFEVAPAGRTESATAYRLVPVKQ